MVDVPLGLDAAGTAQSFRFIVNVTPAAGVIVSGDAHILAVSAATAGGGGAAITMAKSGAHPDLSAGTLTPTSQLKTRIGGLVSDLRGVVTIYFSGQVSANNPYIKPWSARVKRTHSGWTGAGVWYSSRASMLLNGTIRAMNPAHIIYQCLTDSAWGRNLPAAALDEPSFISAANTLYNEGFGLCMKWSRQDNLDTFLQSVINHIGAALYVDRTTGLLTIRMIRADYDAGSLVVFDYDSGLLAVEEDDATSGDTSHNEIVVTWRDPETNEQRSTRAQNLASIQSAGATTSMSTDYPGIPTAEIAARVAVRDLQAQVTGIRRLKLTFDRRGRKIAPGTVFKISVPTRDIVTIVLRAVAIEEGPPTSQSLTVTAVEDVFALHETTYIVAEPPTWVPPSLIAIAPTVWRWREASYADLVRSMSPADLAAVPADSGYIAVVAAKPSSSAVNYMLVTAAVGEDLVERGPKAWTPTGSLAFAIGPYATSFVLAAGFENLDLIGPAGGTAWIENECVGIVSYDPVLGTFSVIRGCLDSVPAYHAAGVRVWFPNTTVATDKREYATSEVVTVVPLTRTTADQLALDDAPEGEIIISGRQGKPYPPGDVRVNGERYADGTTAIGEIGITWTHRDRVLQADTLVPHEAASVGPEAGTTYTIRLYDDASLVRTVTGISGTSWTYTVAMMLADGFVADKVFHLESVRGGLTSTYRYIWTQAHEEAGYGFNYGEHYGVSA